MEIQRTAGRRSVFRPDSVLQRFNQYEGLLAMGVSIFGVWCRGSVPVTESQTAKQVPPAVLSLCPFSGERSTKLEIGQRGRVGKRKGEVFRLSVIEP